VIRTLPATLTVDASAATARSTDGRCVAGRSIWFRYRAPADGPLRLTTVGSDYDTVLAVFSGSRDDRELLRCSDDATIGLTSAARVRTVAGTTYWIAVSACCGRTAPAGVARLHAYRQVPLPSGTVTAVSAAAGGVSGRLLVTATARCSTDSAAVLSVVARQRVGDAVARGYGESTATPCSPGHPTTLTVPVDSDTGWAFQAGRPVLLDGPWAVSNDLKLTSGDWTATLPVADAPDGRVTR
jgi:hypothetical protein